MYYLKYIFHILAIITIVSAVKANYNGYKLIQVTPKDNVTVSLLKDIKSRGYGEFWEEQFVVGQSVKIMVSPQNTADFLQFVQSNGIEYKEVLADIQK